MKRFTAIIIAILATILFTYQSFAHEDCDTLLNYEKEFVCPKSKDPEKCLKEAYSDYGKCMESMKNRVPPEPEPPDECEVKCESIRKSEYSYCIKCVDADEVSWLWGYKG